MRFANDFHSWHHHSWKSLANRLTRETKIVIHGNSYIIPYFMFLMKKFSTQRVTHYHAGVQIIPGKAADALALFVAVDA